MDPRAGVTPSIRNFAHAIDRQRQALERIPLLDVTRPDLVGAAPATGEAEAAALALAPGADLAPLAAVARAVSIPVLRADVLAEEFRIYESRSAGADAVLLSASAGASCAARPGCHLDPHGCLRGLRERRGDRPGGRCPSAGGRARPL